MGLNVNDIKLGVVGCGKMASAIITGIKNSCCSKNLELMGSEVNCEIAELAKTKLGIDVIVSNRALVKNCDIIFIATKPNYVQSVLEEIKDEITSEKLLVSIAAGVSTEKIEKITSFSDIENSEFEYLANKYSKVELNVRNQIDKMKGTS